MPGDVTFNPQGSPVSDAETLDIYRRGSQPLRLSHIMNPILRQISAPLVRLILRARTFDGGWRLKQVPQQAVHTDNRAGIQPVDHDQYGTFQFGIVEAEFTCTEGEPFFAEITEAEAGLGEILLTVGAEQGSAAITSYDATCADTDGNETDASSTGTSPLPDLENGEDYTCTVTATNSHWH